MSAPIRAALASLGAAMIVVLAAGAAAPTSLAATVSCPELVLLSDELERAPSVSVVTVLREFEHDDGRGVVVSVEEIWRGPSLSPVVRVTLEDAAGATTLEPGIGATYLLAAEPFGGAPGIEEPISELLVRSCSVSRPLTPQHQDLRPSDARTVDGSVPASASDEPVAAVAPWVWPLAVLLLLGAAVIATFTDGRGRLARAISLTLGAGGAAALGSAIALSVAEPLGQVVAATPVPTLSGVAPERSGDAPLGEDPTLVIRLEVRGHAGLPQHGGLLEIVSLHADGRLISSAMEGGWLVLREQRLTPEGVDLLRDAVAATALLGADAAADAAYLPQPRPGVEHGARGGFSETLTAATEAGPRTVTWTPIDEGDADLFAEAPEIERLEALAQRLLAPGSWMPNDAWAGPDPTPYRAHGFGVTATTLPPGAGEPAMELAALAWPLTTDIGELTPTPDALGRPTRCAQLSRSQAAELLASIGEGLRRSDMTLASAQTDVAVHDSATSVRYGLTLRPLLPDQHACPEPTGEAPSAELLPGDVALVRVDGLRVRSGAGSSFDAIDAFSAGERVSIVAGPLEADGMNWYEVRQGPSGRGGHVTTGPVDDDPWLVATRNGSIALLRGDGTGASMRLERVEADGSGLTALLDGGHIAWAPDGRRFAFSTQTVDPVPRILLATPDGTGVTTLTEGEYPAWSPDGSRIAFGRDVDLYVVAADGSGLKRLATSAPAWEIAWSPDGTEIAFMRGEAVPVPEGAVAPMPVALWIVDVDSGEERQLTRPEILEVSGGPAWSPDGTRLTYGGNRMIALNGTELLRLEFGAAWADDPWSPDGSRLAIVVDRTIEVRDMEGGTHRTIAAGFGVSHVVWSPDGRRLAFTAAGPSQPWTIRVVDVSDGAPVEIGPAYSQFPVWQRLVVRGLD